MKPAAVTEKKRVKFEEKEPPSRDFVSANATKSSALLETGSPLMSLVNDVGLECLWRAQNIDRPSSGHLVLLSTLCNTYGSVELARHLFCGFTETVAEDDCAHMNMNFTEVILLPWLKRTEKYDDQRKRELFVSRLGDVLLMLYKLGTSSEKIELLDLLSQVSETVRRYIYLEAPSRLDELQVMTFFLHMFRMATSNCSSACARGCSPLKRTRPCTDGGVAHSSEKPWFVTLANCARGI